MSRAFLAPWAQLLPVAALLSACASTGGAPKGEWEPPPWPQGHFELLASVSYRMDSEQRVSTEREEFRGDLSIASDGTMSFYSSSGLCHQRNQAEVEADRVRGQRTFSCQNVRYILKPLGGTIGGDVFVTVHEGIRARGGCEQWGENSAGNRVCLKYSWIVNDRTTTKRASLRVLPGSSRHGEARPGL